MFVFKRLSFGMHCSLAITNGYTSFLFCKPIATKKKGLGKQKCPNRFIRNFVKEKIFSLWRVNFQFSIFNFQLGLGPCHLRVISVSPPTPYGPYTDHTRAMYGLNTLHLPTACPSAFQSHAFSNLYGLFKSLAFMALGTDCFRRLLVKGGVEKGVGIGSEVKIFLRLRLQFKKIV